MILWPLKAGVQILVVIVILLNHGMSSDIM